MDFDGAVTREGLGYGVIIVSPKMNKSKPCSFKLAFDCTNNVVNYEALILGLHVLKDLGEKGFQPMGIES